MVNARGGHNCVDRLYVYVYIYIYVCIHYTTLHDITLHYTAALHPTKLQYVGRHYATLHYDHAVCSINTVMTTTPHSPQPLTSTKPRDKYLVCFVPWARNGITLHSLRYTIFIILHYTKLHYFGFHYATLLYSTLYYTPLHYTSLH